MKANTVRKIPASQAKTSGTNRKAKKAAAKKLKVVSNESRPAEDHAPAVDSMEPNQVHLGQAQIEAQMGQAESGQEAQSFEGPAILQPVESESTPKKWWQRALANNQSN